MSRRDGHLESNVFKQGVDYFANGAPSNVPNPVPHLISAATWNAMTQTEKKQQATIWTAKGANNSFVYAAGNQVASLRQDGNMDVISRVTGFSSGDQGRSQTQVFPETASLHLVIYRLGRMAQLPSLRRSLLLGRAGEEELKWKDAE